jgi:hypothetical protein
LQPSFYTWKRRLGAEPATADRGSGPRLLSVRLPLALLGCGIGVLYLVFPDFLSVAIGFLKVRLVLIPQNPERAWGWYVGWYITERCQQKSPGGPRDWSKRGGPEV